jgi:hypothetical protein
VFTDGRQQRQPNHYTNTICGRIMIGLSLLSSVSKHNMWYNDWVVVVVDNPIIIRPHIVFTDERQQPNLNTTTLCLLMEDNNDNPRCLPSVNTICGRIKIGLSLLSFVSKHNMWSYYDWVVVVLLWFFVSFRIFFSDNTIVRIFIFFVAQSAKFCSRRSHYDWVVVVAVRQ